MKAIQAGAQIVLLVVGLFSGYLKAVAPISDESLQIVPGGIAAFSALILLLLARAVAKSLLSARGRRIFWLTLALAASLPTIWAMFRYADLWKEHTVEVPVASEKGKIEEGRRVKGTDRDFTDRAQAFAAKKGIRNLAEREKDLIGGLGGISEVWTRESIQRQWWMLTRAYALSVVGAVLALAFLAQVLAPSPPHRRPAGSTNGTSPKNTQSPQAERGSRRRNGKSPRT